MPFKLWNSAETLTSSDVNTYLGKQSVITCTEATRPTTGLVEGMTIYQTDTDNLWFYDGATWMPATPLQPIKPTGATNGTVSGNVVTVGNGVSSVTVSGVFSSTYNSYLISMEGGTMSASASIGLQLGASATGYYGFLSYGDVGANTPLGAARNNSTIMNFVGGGVAGQAAHVHVVVMSPARATYTKFVGGAYQNGNAYGTLQGEHRVATAYTSFLLQPDSGTFTGGQIRVYGYR
jgi:hypothetical protein